VKDFICRCKGRAILEGLDKGAHSDEFVGVSGLKKVVLRMTNENGRQKIYGKFGYSLAAV